MRVPVVLIVGGTLGTALQEFAKMEKSETKGRL